MKEYVLKMDCPECDGTAVLFKQNFGTGTFVCEKCGSKFIPAWLMNQNLKQLQKDGDGDG